MKVKKNIRVFVAILLIVALSSACSESEPDVKGIIRNDDGDWYVVELPDGKVATDYFAKKADTSRTNVVITYFGQNGSKKTNAAGNCYEVEGGGWICDGGSVILYIPYSASKQTAQAACGTLSTCKSNGNWMSFEEAEQYISYLK